MIQYLEGKEIQDLDTNKVLDFFNSIIKEYTYMGSDKEKTQEQITKMLFEPHQAFALNIIGDSYVVVGHISFVPKQGRFKHVAGIGMAVLKEYRGQGIGTKLMQLAIDNLKKNKGIKIIGLGVYENNKIALNLYKKFGFKEVARLPKVLQWQPDKSKPLQYKDEILMHLYLDDF